MDPPPKVAHNHSTAGPAGYSVDEWRLMAEASAATDGKINL